ncbi:MAG TPA: hypothetical protein VJV78_43360 [Polyangiales bacterium]|nr:hypothetical protein [Polyangiales bacterium]
MHSFVKSSAALLVALLAACASQPQSAQPTTPAAPASQPSAAGEDLRGTWVEYWAVSGAADTDRFAFDAQGHFDWRASAKAAQEQAQGAIEKAGAFRVEQAGQASVLVLEVEHERFAGCASPCTQAGEPREVHHSAPIIERYELGECPVNPEAQRIDAGYTCRAIGGKAFWRKPEAATPQS